MLAYLCEQGLVVDAGGGVVFAAAVYGELVARVLRQLRANGSISLGEARDLLGTSRKYAQALLERMDAEKLTRRVGETRLAGARAEGGR
ncbi:MAG: SelB C-terminal domain-containing protein [Dehalococcoidia bacterium]|nr:SelB C-terminal domain-containing protein [Dehalococcoidia bacterium]